MSPVSLHRRMPFLPAAARWRAFRSHRLLALIAALLLIMPCPNWAAGFVSTLDPAGKYGSEEKAKECLIVTWNSALKVLSPPGEPTNFALCATCLRMAFHDAASWSTDSGEGGSNGSIMEDEEMSLGINVSLPPCRDAIKATIRNATASGCTPTNADAVAVVGAIAVALSGGPACQMIMGRHDQGFADSAASLGSFPGPCLNAKDQTQRFAQYGFEDPAAALVTLLGAHSIGEDHGFGCLALGGDIRTNGTGVGPMTTQPTKFDNHYYSELINTTNKTEGGFFNSDAALFTGNGTTALVQKYAANNTAFIADWCPYYRLMTVFGVNQSAFQGVSWPVPSGAGIPDNGQSGCVPDAPCATEKLRPANATSPSTSTTPPSTNATPPSTNATPPSTNATPPSTNVTPPSTNATPPSTNATPPSTNVTSPSPSEGRPGVNLTSQVQLQLEKAWCILQPPSANSLPLPFVGNLFQLPVVPVCKGPGRESRVLVPSGAGAQLPADAVGDASREVSVDAVRNASADFSGTEESSVAT